MKRIALYPGSFDPVTNGHCDLLTAALALFDEVVIGIGVNAGKSPLFTLPERQEMLREVVSGMGPAAANRTGVISFDALAVEAARAIGAGAIIRGVRDSTDLDYEMQMAGMNAALAPEIRTLFLPASPAARIVSSTLVRQLARMGGNIDPFVPEPVARKLRLKSGS
ncbi:MAG: pantetheine-phosphate adenylyltransferase [Bauldia sp.]